MTIDIEDTGGSITMTMNGARGTCTMHGARSQSGRLVTGSGAYACGGPMIGQLYMLDLYPTWSGFTGSFGLDGYPIGRIEGARITPH